MKSSNKLNRNMWSKQDIQTLIDHVSNAKTVGKGFKSAATILNRSTYACISKYYKIGRTIKNKPINKQPIKAENTTILTFRIKSWYIKNGELKVEVYKQG